MATVNHRWQGVLVCFAETSDNATLGAYPMLLPSYSARAPTGRSYTCHNRDTWGGCWRSCDTHREGGGGHVTQVGRCWRSHDTHREGGGGHMTHIGRVLEVT